MTTALIGIAAGALMAKTFITIWCLALFFLYRDPPPALAAISRRFSPTALVMGMVAAAYPLWGIIGVVLAFLFLALQNAAPAAGLGSPNMAYTLGVSLAAVLLAAPLAVAFRRIRLALAATAATFAATFGWLMPLLAT